MFRLTFSLAAVLAGMAATGFPSPAQASEGGEGGKANACPYAQDQHVDIGGRPLVIPQSAFAGKSDDVMIGDYRVAPDVGQLKLIIVGPNSEIWEAGLSVLVGGKRCTAYYVGTPVLINAPIAAAPHRTTASH
jgi:hypothetical protein